MGTKRKGENGFGLLIGERISSGGMGEIYRGKILGPLGFEKLVAVKRVIPSVSGTSDSERLFAAEMCLSARLQHPNIIQVFHNGFDGKCFYVVMEYIDGKNLREIQQAASVSGREGGLNEASCCYVISEAARGLAHAHDFRDPVTKEPLRVVHRDVSPQNIMVRYDGGVQVIDFGIARFSGREEITQVGNVRGKVAYLSPEQARGEVVDARSDLFSLGVVFYELLTGRRPFEGDSLAEILDKIQNAEPVAPSKYNKEVTETLDFVILHGLLAKRPADRIPSAKALVHKLERDLHFQHPLFTQSSFFDFVGEYLR